MSTTTTRLPLATADGVAAQVLEVTRERPGNGGPPPLASTPMGRPG